MIDKAFLNNAELILRGTEDAVKEFSREYLLELIALARKGLASEGLLIALYEIRNRTIIWKVAEHAMQMQTIHTAGVNALNEFHKAAGEK